MNPKLRSLEKRVENGSKCGSFNIIHADTVWLRLRRFALCPLVLLLLVRVVVLQELAPYHLHFCHHCLLRARLVGSATAVDGRFFTTPREVVVSLATPKPEEAALISA